MVTTTTTTPKLQHPLVKRLRTLEHSRMTRFAAQRERLVKTLEHVDRALKHEVQESLKSQAATLTELAEILREETEKKEQSEQE